MLSICPVEGMTKNRTGLKTDSRERKLTEPYSNVPEGARRLPRRTMHLLGHLSVAKVRTQSPTGGRGTVLSDLLHHVTLAVLSNL